MRSVLDVFVGLPVPLAQGDVFSVEPHPHHPEMLIGKDSEGSPAVICPGARSRGGTVPVRLRNVLLLPEAHIQVTRGGVPSTMTSAIYRCRSVSAALREYFLVAVTSILSSHIREGTVDAASVLRSLAELFHDLEGPARATVQGFWGEMFVVCESAEPGAMLDAWRSDPYERFDFAAGADRLEVKTCGSTDRSHHFSVEQVRPPSPIRATIVSLMCARSVGGASVGDLIEKLRGFTVGPSQALKLERIVVEALGGSLADCQDTAFDLEGARASLRFFPAEIVPSVPKELPTEVFNVRFEARLSDSLALPPSHTPDAGSLLAAAWPSKRKGAE